ncbi:hypothetical protein CCHR01_01597 [Colletotrichum chrysophilum]|uniref:Uncharacterized protein n=1 Tax=Colletotrichum chrysophilum TaxID=1836956 RepID=A0AAD9AWF2_9PEZI|nr:hypothetical protein CCHR01_01597 [Colletotrichum chrysophilum]
MQARQQSPEHLDPWTCRSCSLGSSHSGVCRWTMPSNTSEPRYAQKPGTAGHRTSKQPSMSVAHPVNGNPPCRVSRSKQQRRLATFPVHGNRIRRTLCKSKFRLTVGMANSGVDHVQSLRFNGLITIAASTLQTVIFLTNSRLARAEERFSDNTESPATTTPVMPLRETSMVKSRPSGTRNSRPTTPGIFSPVSQSVAAVRASRAVAPPAGSSSQGWCRSEEKATWISKCSCQPYAVSRPSYPTGHHSPNHSRLHH